MAYTCVMAYVNVEEIVDGLRSDFRRALTDTIAEVAPDAGIDGDEMFRAFLRGVRRRFGTWEQVPDRCVKR
jgi:hypothetical protein